MRDLRPGRRFALWYEDDTYWHERVALARVRPGVRIIATPDGDRYAENVRCKRGASGAVQAVLLDHGGELLSRLRGRFYRFKEALAAPKLVEQIKLAEGEAYGITRRRQEAPDTIVLWGGDDVQYQPLMDSDGTELVPLAGDGEPAAPPGGRLGPVPLPPPAGDPPESTWLIIDPMH